MQMELLRLWRLGWCAPRSPRVSGSDRIKAQLSSKKFWSRERRESGGVWKESKEVLVTMACGWLGDVVWLCNVSVRRQCWNVRLKNYWRYNSVLYFFLATLYNFSFYRFIVLATIIPLFIHSSIHHSTHKATIQFHLSSLPPSLFSSFFPSSIHPSIRTSFQEALIEDLPCARCWKVSLLK